MLIPKKGDGNTPIRSDTLLDRSHLLFTIQKGFPRIKVPDPVKIAPCDVGVFFKADDVKDIVPVGNLPGVDILAIPVPVVPEKKRILKTLLGGVVRVTGNNKSILFLGLEKDLLVVPRSRNEFFDIDQEEMSRFVGRERVLGNLDSRNNQQPISIPCPLCLFCNVRHIRTKTFLCHGEFKQIRKLPKRIVSIHHMIRNGNDIKTCLAEKVYRSPETYRPIGISCVNMEIAKQHYVKSLIGLCYGLMTRR
jgi:hypothetical protein